MLDSLLGGMVSLVVSAVNALVAAVGAVLSALFSALPDMPALPSPPPSFTMAEGWVAWVFPVSTVIDILTFSLSMILLWSAVSLGLRWARMSRGGA